MPATTATLRKHSRETFHSSVSLFLKARAGLKLVTSKSGRGAPVSVKFRIDVFKDGKDITANFDVRVADTSITELIADFHLNVDGQNLIPEFQSGQTRFHGARSAILKNPERDATVSFDIASNQGFTASDSDTLRGEKLRDSSTFAN
jgi:hypothetical protein